VARLNPGPGEILDRLLVLNLKLTMKEDAAVETRQAWRQEKAELEERWLGLVVPPEKGVELHELSRELARSNGVIWRAQDVALSQVTPQQMRKDAALLAVLENFDRRAKLIEAVNVVFGDGWKEKG